MESLSELFFQADACYKHLTAKLKPVEVHFSSPFQPIKRESKTLITEVTYILTITHKTDNVVYEACVS